MLEQDLMATWFQLLHNELGCIERLIRSIEFLQRQIRLREVEVVVDVGFGSLPDCLLEVRLRFCVPTLLQKERSANNESGCSTVPRDRLA